MKTLWLAACLLLLIACGDGREPESAAAATPASIEPYSTFRIRNAEIREEITAAMSERGIEYWVEEDGSLRINTADNEAVDAIYYDAVGRYAARN